MRELPSPDELLKPRDRAPLIYVSAGTWHCVICADEDARATTVIWLGPNSDGPHGRCMTCGQKYLLARPFEAVPEWREQRSLYVRETR